MDRRAVFLVFVVLSTAASAQQIDWSSPEAIGDRAVAASPALRALDARIEAAREAVRAAGSLPNPMAMGGVQDLQQDLENDPMMTMFMVGASQTFVPERRRESAREAERARVDQLQAERAALSASLARDGRALWITVAAIDGRIEVIEDVLGVADSMTAAARARYETGTAIQADVMRAQLARSNLTHRLLALQGSRRSATASLRSLLDLPADANVPPIALAHGHDPASVSAFVPLDTHAAIAALRAQARRSEARIALARSANRPDWNLEAAYGFRPEGENMISVMGRVELPIRRSERIEPRIREAIAEREASLALVEELRRILTERAAIAGSVREEALEQIRFHEEVLVPQARLAFDATLAAYQTGRVDFQALLGAEIAYVEMALELVDFLERALVATADLHALASGATTIRVAPTSMGFSISTAADATGPAGGMSGM